MWLHLDESWTRHLLRTAAWQMPQPSLARTSLWNNLQASMAHHVLDVVACTATTAANSQVRTIKSRCLSIFSRQCKLAGRAPSTGWQTCSQRKPPKMRKIVSFKPWQGQWQTAVNRACSRTQPDPDLGARLRKNRVSPGSPCRASASPCVSRHLRCSLCSESIFGVRAQRPRSWLSMRRDSCRSVPSTSGNQRAPEIGRACVGRVQAGTPGQLGRAPRVLPRP